MNRMIWATLLASLFGTRPSLETSLRNVVEPILPVPSGGMSIGPSDTLNTVGAQLGIDPAGSSQQDLAEWSQSFADTMLSSVTLDQQAQQSLTLQQLGQMQQMLANAHPNQSWGAGMANTAWHPAPPPTLAPEVLAVADQKGLSVADKADLLRVVTILRESDHGV